MADDLVAGLLGALALGGGLALGMELGWTTASLLAGGPIPA
jgi:hypothetical protein